MKCSVENRVLFLTASNLELSANIENLDLLSKGRFIIRMFYKKLVLNSKFIFIFFSIRDNIMFKCELPDCDNRIYTIYDSNKPQLKEIFSFNLKIIYVNNLFNYKANVTLIENFSKMIIDNFDKYDNYDYDNMDNNESHVRQDTHKDRNKESIKSNDNHKNLKLFNNDGINKKIDYNKKYIDKDNQEQGDCSIDKNTISLLKENDNSKDSIDLDKFNKTDTISEINKNEKVAEFDKFFIKSKEDNNTNNLDSISNFNNFNDSNDEDESNNNKNNIQSKNIDSNKKNKNEKNTIEEFSGSLDFNDIDYSYI